ncbi:MAG: hypothetical protein NC320_00595 [Clostridium sp.]|nr:hypothetical protein [Clostridium sp.]MCM1546841.1 hypothetical protein [Ruminococcus sp.]
MKRLKHYFPNYILSVLLVLFIVGFSAVYLLSTVFKASFFIDSLEKNNVYKYSSDYTYDYFEKSVASSGIPAEIYMESLDDKIIKQSVDGKINAFFDYITGKTDKIEAPDIDYSGLEKSISDYFDKFAKENNVEVNDKFKTQLDKTIETAKKDVNSFTNVFMLDYMEKAGIHKKLRTVYPLISVAVYIMAGGIILITAGFFILNKKEISSALYWFSVSGICASVIGLVPCVILNGSDYFSRLIMRTDYIFYAVTGILGDSVDTLMKTQIFILIASVIIMICFAAASMIKGKNA